MKEAINLIISQTLQDFAMLRHEFNDSPRIQRDIAILTHHRNFPANLKNHCRLPQLSPFRGYTKGGNSALRTQCRHVLAEF